MIFVYVLCFNQSVKNKKKIAGADPGFQVGGGGHLKTIVPSGGRREIFGGISCEMYS